MYSTMDDDEDEHARVHYFATTVTTTTRLGTVLHILCALNLHTPRLIGSRHFTANPRKILSPATVIKFLFQCHTLISIK